MPRPQSKNEYVTREVLKKELSLFEKRLSRKIEWGDVRLEAKIGWLERRVDRYLIRSAGSPRSPLSVKARSTTQRKPWERRFVELQKKMGIKPIIKP